MFCVGQNPCKNVNCGRVCRGEDLWERECVNGECVELQISEEDSRECGYRPCKSLFCDFECFETELWKMKCQEGECVQDFIVEYHSKECGYIPEVLADVPREEYCVYRAYIENTFTEETVVVLDHTFWGTYMVYAWGLTQFGVSLSEKMPELEEETWDCFEARNEEKYHLSDFFNLSKHVVFISEEDMVMLFKWHGGWEEFRSLYPSSQGIMNLSRVGFNADKTQALLYAGNQTGWTSGSGWYVLFVKKNGAWVIQKKVMVWVS